MIDPCDRCGGNGFIHRRPCGCREAMCGCGPLLGHPEEPREGLYQKFWVRRTDGRSSKGRKHEKCDYLVLDWVHDPFAIPAALAYARACQQKYPELAADIRARAARAKREAKHGKARVKAKRRHEEPSER